MIGRIRSIPVELNLSLAMLAIAIGASLAFGLPMRLPDPDGAAFVGIHYVLPLAGIVIWGVCAYIGARRDLVRTFVWALPSYMIVLWVHFHLKLWAPYIHPTSYDGLFWRMDEAARPLIECCRSIRAALAGIIPYWLHLYMFGFIAMFYSSFCYFAVRKPNAFRRLFLAAFLIQSLGALSYLAMPALGPFLYEPALSPFVQHAQAHMLATHQTLVANGPSWLSAHEAKNLLAGLGAMPSLHAGTSFLFVWFAYRYARVLLPTYSLMFGYILITAIANRWHYLIDLPVGIALACLCIYLSGKLAGESESVRERLTARHGGQEPGWAAA